MLKIRVLIRVRYGETDQMGVVYNANYIRYLEVSRTELLRKVGLPYKVMEQSGFQLPVVETWVKHKAPALYDDILEVEASYKELFKPIVHLDYKISNKKNGNILLEGYTKHPFIRVEDKKPTRPPEVYISTLKKYFEDETEYDVTNWGDEDAELFI